jgi:uncharacterized protein (DUF1697 family)
LTGGYIALLRGINVGGKNMLPMPALREMFAALGFPNAKTWLQSGNIVFEAPPRNAGELERLLEAETFARLEVQPDYFVRTAKEWGRVVADNPFPREAEADPSHLVVMALKGAPSATQVSALRAAIKGRETVAVSGRHAYLFYPDGIGDSKLTPRVIEDKLGTRGTARNWNTARKLLALAQGA